MFLRSGWAATFLDGSRIGDYKPTYRYQSVSVSELAIMHKSRIITDEKWEEQVLSKEETVSHEEASAAPHRGSPTQAAWVDAVGHEIPARENPPVASVVTLCARLVAPSALPLAPAA